MKKLDELLKSPSAAPKVQAVLNVLLEAPYFYKSDDEDLFLFLLRYKREFAAFFESHFGWTLVTDAKCARIYKPRWYNDRITPSNRDCFNFTRRDDCIAFMLLLEFFESRTEAESVSVDDPDNYRFRFGELFEFQRDRFRELFPDAADSYGDEEVRRILRGVMPTLERYRFLLRIRPPADENVTSDEVIYECLPALWHYSATAVSRPVGAGAESEAGDQPSADGEETP
ncbi:MAG: DUF2398 family protein [Lentisphaerae bacterium]|jgi:hypothetical protein|nr:DUF2398 family protein [Lentisphaerota bacterium]